MIDIEEIEREINKLEMRGDTTYSVCERLSWLYTVRDHLIPNDTKDATIPDYRGSEFLELASGVSCQALLGVINEHLEALKIVYPKSYDAVMDKIRALKWNL